ncbi:OmpA/MotB family protein [Cellulosimicrobium cellulans]|uniref:OmpA/MotB family protein n=1 Tax=Cellulosimicrobium cellulans TaxID=1710 RepID=UPI0020CD9B1C|nr:OmpA family protein [Cellulosimicrobium cellulans]
MRRLLHRGRSAEATEDSVWISFSDLMTSLLTIFMLAAVVLVLSLTQKQEALATEQERAEAQQQAFDQTLGSLSEAETVRAQMLVEIRDALAAQGIEVTVSADNSVLSIPTSLLGFEAGSYEIRPQHQQLALTIGDTIAEVLSRDDRYTYLDTVFVEGHTDNTPFPGLEGSGNWGLSTFRAISLWRLWDERLAPERQLDSLQREDGRTLFSVAGYGESRPATATQLTDDERAANRRIDVRFTEKRLSAENLAAILDAQISLRAGDGT